MRHTNRWRNELRRYGAEGLGTFGIVVAGAGSSATAQYMGSQGTLVGASLAAGFVVMAMIYTFGHISGAHFNPAVTIAFTVARHFPLWRLPGYILSQIAGALLGAAVLRGLVGDAVKASVTLPGPGVSQMQAVGMEILLSFFLMLVITAVATDTRAVGQAAAIAIGVTVIFAILLGGPFSGASMNPARSFGPAVLAGQFQKNWLYWIGPILGATLGAVAYQLVRGDGPIGRTAQ